MLVNLCVRASSPDAMSLAMITAVRPLKMPSSPKVVLLALADYADDNGLAWPSIPKICEFSCLCERSVHAAVKWLEAHRLVRCDRTDGRHTSYVITPAAFAVVDMATATTVGGDIPPQQMHPRSSCAPAADADTPAVNAVVPPQQVQSPPQQMRSNHQEPPVNHQRTTKPPAAEVVDLPDWLPRVEWRAYVEMRSRIRKPLTAHAVKLAIGKLDELRMAGDDPKAVLNNSVLGSWQGLFAIRKQNAGPSRLATPVAGTDYGSM